MPNLAKLATLNGSYRPVRPFTITIDHPRPGSSVGAFRFRFPFQSHNRSANCPHLRLTHAGPLWRDFGPSGHKFFFLRCAFRVLRSALNSINASNPIAIAHRPSPTRPFDKPNKRGFKPSGNCQWTWAFELQELAGGES